MRKLPIPEAVGVTVDVGNVIMHQLPINANIATTGHKLQGMSKKIIVVTEWGTFTNWVYVVLSRVTTLQGLFILKKFNTKNLASLTVPQDLINFENAMRQKQQDFIRRIQLVKH